jgi:hypothetical protein
MLVGMFQVTLAYLQHAAAPQHLPWCACHAGGPRCVHMLGVLTPNPGCVQAANVLHDAFDEPGRVLWRKVRRLSVHVLGPTLHRTIGKHARHVSEPCAWPAASAVYIAAHWYVVRRCGAMCQRC